MGRFTNKIVVIAGGTSGIGLAAAREFIRQGRHTTYAAARSEQIFDLGVQIMGSKGEFAAECRIIPRAS